MVNQLGDARVQLLPKFQLDDGELHIFDKSRSTNKKFIDWLLTIGCRSTVHVSVFL